MALAVVGVPITTTHGAPQLHGQLGNKGFTSLRGKSRNSTVAPKNSSTFTIHCSSSKGENANVVVLNEPVEVQPADIIGRSSFPHGFVFGSGSAAYQVEGGVNERGWNIWDTFCLDFPEKITDKSNGNIATDSYNRYKEDVKLMKDMGWDAYRFSISWSRILPKGRGLVNRKGVEYYNNLINELIKNGIKPYVTLFHWDVPQSLEDEYGGFLNRRIIKDFEDYCEICFKEFGDRVKDWITVNEPWALSTFGYGKGTHAPGRCSELPDEGIACPVGDSAREPYIVAHNLILAHAKAVKLYKEKFQHIQQGQIGITLVSHWYEPYHDQVYKDREAQGRALDFHLGWFMDPLINGDYPFNMRALVRERLPYFKDDEQEMVKGSFDFIGLNYYTGRYARSLPIPENNSPIYYAHDSYADIQAKRDGIPIGNNVPGSWINVYPNGIKHLLCYIKLRYGNPPLYIIENGICEVDKKEFPVENPLADPMRESYHIGHLKALKEAIDAGSKVKGYFTWPLTDNFEWGAGYTQRFGLIYIDYKDNLTRIKKESTEMFTWFLKQ